MYLGDKCAEVEGGSRRRRNLCTYESCTWCWLLSLFSYGHRPEFFFLPELLVANEPTCWPTLCRYPFFPFVLPFISIFTISLCIHYRAYSRRSLRFVCKSWKRKYQRLVTFPPCLYWLFFFSLFFQIIFRNLNPRNWVVFSRESVEMISRVILIFGTLAGVYWVDFLVLYEYWKVRKYCEYSTLCLIQNLKDFTK